MRKSVATPAPRSAVVAGERIEKACQEAGPHSVGRHDNHCHYLSPIQSSHRGVPGENHLVPADPSALHFPGSLRRFQVPFGIFQTSFANTLPECWLPKRLSRFRSSRCSKHSRIQKEEDLFPIPTRYSSNPLPQHSPCSARPAPAGCLPPKTSPRYQNDRARLRKKGSIEKKPIIRSSCRKHPYFSGHNTEGNPLQATFSQPRQGTPMTDHSSGAQQKPRLASWTVRKKGRADFPSESSLLHWAFRSTAYAQNSPAAATAQREFELRILPAKPLWQWRVTHSTNNSEQHFIP